MTAECEGQKKGIKVGTHATLSVMSRGLIDCIMIIVDTYFGMGSRLLRTYLKAFVTDAIIVSDEKYGIKVAVALGG